MLVGPVRPDHRRPSFRREVPRACRSRTSLQARYHPQLVAAARTCAPAIRACGAADSSRENARHPRDRAPSTLDGAHERMLINATQREELRVALVDGQKLYDLSIDSTVSRAEKGNVYKARVTRVEPKPLKPPSSSTVRSARASCRSRKSRANISAFQPAPGARFNIRDVLQEGQELLVQVEKEERGNKGAAHDLHQPRGTFLVLMPNNPRAGGVSRRIEGEDRDVTRDSLEHLKIPDGMGTIVRTAGVGRGPEELQWDLDNLRANWDAIVTAAGDAPPVPRLSGERRRHAGAARLPSGRHRRSPDRRARRPPAGARVRAALPVGRRAAPDQALHRRRAALHALPDREPDRVGVLALGHPALRRQHRGIDYTEALVSIDINSARATRGADIETTAYNTNLEATDEISRQLRIRDLGGLIVIDFIDMESKKNQQGVEDRLREPCQLGSRAHPARPHLPLRAHGDVAPAPASSLGESTHMACPRCSGMGSIRSVESMALAVLRLIGEEVRKDRTDAGHRTAAGRRVDLLINEKREWLHQLRVRARSTSCWCPTANMQTPNYSIRRRVTTRWHCRKTLRRATSWQARAWSNSTSRRRPTSAPPRRSAAVTPSLAPGADARGAPPARVVPAGPGFWSRLFSFLRQRSRPRTHRSVGGQAREERPGNRHGRDHRDHREDRGGRRIASHGSRAAPGP